MYLPIVAIVGRPNVGKSTLFNRLSLKKKSITDDTSGTTRDRIFEYVEWSGKQFILIDTGGIVPRTIDKMEVSILRQVDSAIEQADVLLFLVDNKTGITDIDEEIARMVRKTGKKAFLAVNKVDNMMEESQIYEFLSLGFKELYPISAIQGRSTGDLLDAITEDFPEREDELPEEGVKIAVVGQPNAGKSSFVNKLLNEDRHIVSDVPGTTRDSVNSEVTYFGEKYVFIDTAGLRKKTRIKESLEYYSSLRSYRSIDQCDIAYLLIDAEKGITSFDLKIASYITEKQKGLIIVVNKWDLIEKETNTAKKFTEDIREKFSFCQWAPVLYISALTGMRLRKTLELTKQIVDGFNFRVPTADLNKIFEAIISRNTPPAVRGTYNKFFYVTQVKEKPPTFVIICKFPNDIPDTYKRYLDREFRKYFPFTGVTLGYKFKSRKSKKYG